MRELHLVCLEIGGGLSQIFDIAANAAIWRIICVVFFTS